MRAYKNRGSIILVLAIIVVVLMVGLIYLTFKTYPPKSQSAPIEASSTVVLTSTSTPVVNTQATSSPVSVSQVVRIYLGQPFSLHKKQVAKLGEGGLEVRITNFYNSPCPPKLECFWSGIGVGLEYRLNGQIQTGVNLNQAFGYEVKILATDYQTYAKLVVNKLP
jgi:hypothetical protein